MFIYWIPKGENFLNTYEQTVITQQQKDFGQVTVYSLSHIMS